MDHSTKSVINWAKYPCAPYGFQREIVEATWDKPYWAFFMEMGTGKSLCAIATLVELYLAGKVDTVLYVAKKGELSNFQTYELTRHKPDGIVCTAMIYRGYTNSREVQKIKHMLSPSSALRVFSMNIESIRSDTGRAIAEAYLRSSKKTLLIVDESTTLKDRKSTQYKSMASLRSYAKYVRLMTGTVIPHSPVDIYCQTAFMDKHCLGYGGVTAFKADFLVTEKKFFGPRQFHAVVGTKNLDVLSSKIKRVATVLLKKDCLDLPDKVYKPHAVELTDVQRGYYQDLVDFSFSNIEGELVTATNALSVMTKLHQIVCGQIRIPEENEYRLIPNNRYEAVKEILSNLFETQSKVVIWSHFVAASQGLADYLRKAGFNLVHLKGGISLDERAAMIDQFKTDPSTQIFLGNPQSSGFGLTLTEASTAIYFSNSDNYEHRLQSEDRIHRIGQDQRCLYIDLATPGTVEDAILDRTKMKALQRDQVLSRDAFMSLIQLRS